MDDLVTRINIETRETITLEKSSFFAGWISYTSLGNPCPLSGVERTLPKRPRMLASDRRQHLYFVVPICGDVAALCA